MGWSEVEGPTYWQQINGEVYKYPMRPMILTVFDQSQLVQDLIDHLPDHQRNVTAITITNLHHTSQKPCICWTPVFANLTSSNSQSLSCDTLPQTTIEEETIPTGNVALNSHASRWFIGSLVFISSPFLLVLVVFTVLAACCHGHWHGLQFHSSRRALAWKIWVCLKNRPCPKTKMCFEI